nr:sulfur carrier protein ThiS adenylyltransferase ThiF [Candidatus Omnitrophota bacterium]
MDAFVKNIIKKVGKDNFRKIQDARIGLAGAGGLGSNCACNLVRVGFKRFTIVDFDIIEPANLDRQFYFIDQIGMNKVDSLKTNLLRINPFLELKMINKKIENTNIKELFNDCDVIVECFDRAEYKSMLVSELIHSGKLIIAASGLGGIGSSDNIKVHKIKKNLIIIGDLKSDIDRTPALSPRVNVAAAKQADVVLEFVINR